MKSLCTSVHVTTKAPHPFMNSVSAESHGRRSKDNCLRLYRQKTIPLDARETPEDGRSAGFVWALQGHSDHSTL